VQRKLTRLAGDNAIDLATSETLDSAAAQAMLLGSADILLDELLTLLSPSQSAILHQVAACYGPMTLDNLALPAGEGKISPSGLVPASCSARAASIRVASRSASG
jgi:hypothetical protein